MKTKHETIITVMLAAVLLLCCVNMCSTCSTGSKLVKIEQAQEKTVARVDSVSASQMRQIEIRLEMMQPEIANQFLSIFNLEKYKNEINMNDVKIDALMQQLKNERMKNDTSRKN